jgi:hypothetical protein
MPTVIVKQAASNKMQFEKCEVDGMPRVFVFSNYSVFIGLKNLPLKRTSILSLIWMPPKHKFFYLSKIKMKQGHDE